MRPSVSAGVSLVLGVWLSSPSGAAQAESAPEATARPAASSSAGPGPASAPTASAAAPQPASAHAGRGLVVLVAGDDAQAATACRELAKKVYRSERLRPSIDETSARALCGANPTEPAEAAALAELRRVLTAPVDGVGTRALLEAVARRVPAEGLLVVQREGDELTASLLRAEPASVSSPLRPGRTSLALGSADAELRLSEAVADLEQLFGPPPPAKPTPPTQLPTDPAERGAEQPAGPRRKPSPAPPAPAEDSSLTSSPWFWVAVGSVAALGLSILIVSQATSVDESSVRLQGRVLP